MYLIDFLISPTQVLRFKGHRFISELSSCSLSGTFSRMMQGTFLYLSSPRLEGTEEKFRNRESRPEDLQLIAELKDMVSERESLVKKLVVGNWWLSNTI